MREWNAIVIFLAWLYNKGMSNAYRNFNINSMQIRFGKRRNGAEIS